LHKNDEAMSHKKTRYAEDASDFLFRDKFDTATRMQNHIAKIDGHPLERLFPLAND
jgi:hypothetical protein